MCIRDSLSIVQNLAEHFDTGNNGFLSLFGKTDDLNFVARVELASFHSTSCNGSTTSDGENVFNRHEERQVGFTLRSRDISCLLYTSSPEQLKPKRGGDYTTVSHKAELLLPDGKAVTNLKQIKELIETEIIGLDCGNFSKIVMLPQGQFQKLLTEKSSDKTATFREIFGTEIFQKLTGKLFERTRTTEQQNQTLLAQNKRLLADILTDSPGLLQQQASDCPDFTKVARLLSEQNSADTNRLKELEGEAARISRLELSLQTACAEAEQLKQDFARREELQLQLDALHAEQPRIEQLTVLCQKLRQAEELLPLEESTLQLIERVEQLDEEHRKTLALRQTQTERLENLLPSYQALEQLRYKEDSLKEQIRELLRAEEQKAGIAAAQKQLDHLDQRIKQASREIEACEQRLALDLLQQQLGEFKQLDALQTESEQLAKSLSDAEKAYQRACTHFFEEQAWTMAENLQEGEKCPVCGSVPVSYTHLRAPLPCG